ncbi:MAG: 3-dehydroquinate synthase [Candidatus Omnitrophica bacterium]|nr:3-dehydroquinate synthase [Candidatus Omnitrophota bacterium]
MKQITVQLKEHSYPIVVGDGVLPLLPEFLKKLNLGPDAVVITNPLVNRLHGGALSAAMHKAGFSVKFFEVEDSERSKSAGVAFDLVGKVAEYAADKKPVIIAFGGGVVGDLAGFVAAVYKRGIPFVQVPTTLLAQVDSSIGGKVAVDLPQGKNLAGAFYQPKLVLADASLLLTLSERQLRNGLAEVVKYGVIKDAKLFSFLEKNYAGLVSGDLAALSHVVLTSAAIKARVVELDEKETRGLRTILNFGHTIGHAVETACGYENYYHGEAVALGMRAACAISCQLNLMKPLEAVRVETLLSAIGLPENVEGVSEAAILKAMKFDKKFAGSKNRFVLCTSIGKVLVKEAVSLSTITKALRLILK